MLTNIVHDTRHEHRKLLLAGIAYLTAIALLIAVSIAIYQKVFTPVTMVTVHADRAGLQLSKFGDVRMHGVLIGQVRSISQNGGQAVIKLGLEPAAARAIPANVDVQILPTTLFGQKYVSLVDPAHPDAQPIRDGAVIPSSRVQTSVELESVLARLYPVLTAVRPQDLDVTLNALASALTGRGEKLGTLMTNLDGYLRTFNVHLPTLRTDLRLLADVAHTYDVAAPQLVDLMRNATVTARTVAEEKNQLSAFFADVATMSDTATAVLGDNESAIITEGKLAMPLTRLLDTYSPEFPCVLEGLDRYTGRLNQIFQHSRVSQTMSLAGTQRRAYDRSDRPAYGEVGHGPWCLGLPTPKQGFPLPDRPLKDGTTIDNPVRLP